jgi:SAM-dependent methyltransferase
MQADMHAPASFYATRQGAVAAGLLRQRLAAMWPSLAGQSVVGIGHAAPYLRLWRDQAARCIAVIPAQLPANRWPAEGANLTCAAEEDALPFPDLSIDRVLLVHGLEAAENARRLLREAWRVLRDDGQLLIVAPNRRGLWAHVESTPFGQGQPYSPGQIGRLLTASLFRVTRRDTALYMPPTRLRLVLRSAQLCEDVGHRLLPRFAGLTITEAAKELYGVVPTRPLRRRRVVLIEAR